MDVGATVITVFIIIIRVISFICLLYMIFRMFQEKGIFHAILGFFCCQLYPFIWGWLNSSILRVVDLMTFWTFLIVLDLIVGIVVFYLNPELALRIWGLNDLNSIDVGSLLQSIQ